VGHGRSLHEGVYNAWHAGQRRDIPLALTRVGLNLVQRFVNSVQARIASLSVGVYDRGSKW